jgi:hypothetical protein
LAGINSTIGREYEKFIIILKKKYGGLAGVCKMMNYIASLLDKGLPTSIMNEL